MVGLESQKGFTLVGALIAAGIMAIVSVVMATVIVDQQKNVSFLEDRITKTDLGAYVRGLFLDEAACTETFRGQSISRDEIAVGRIVDGAGAEKLAKGQNYSNIIINAFELTPQPGVLIPAGGTGNMNFKIVLDRKRAKTPFLRPIEFELQVTVDGSREITSCSLRPHSGGGGPVGEDACIVQAYTFTGSNPNTLSHYTSHSQIIANGNQMDVTQFSNFGTGSFHGMPGRASKWKNTFECTNSVPTQIAHVSEGHVTDDLHIKVDGPDGTGL